MFYIYIKKPYNYFSREFFKEIARFIFRKNRGPQAVNKSLIRGLKELGVIFFLNKNNPKLNGTETFFVNSSLDALRWAIKLKKEGKIKKLIAGPNLVVTPDDFDGIILSSEIDYILVPSEWVKKVWLSFNKDIKDKLFIWPSGVEDLGFNNKQKTGPLLYIKNAPKNLIREVILFLEGVYNNFEIIYYGKYLRADYLQKLEKASCVIYLQESESQGISLLEAWMKDVPTFAWTKGVYEIKGKSISGNDVSAPYLNNESGLFFSSLEELKKIMLDFDKNKLTFSPRKYYLENFTDSICAKKLLDIVNEVIY